MKIYFVGFRKGTMVVVNIHMYLNIFVNLTLAINAQFRYFVNAIQNNSLITLNHTQKKIIGEYVLSIEYYYLVIL